MDIYQRLEKDHDTQRALFKKLMDTSGDTEERKDLWRKLKVELEAHASAEEQTFYAALMEKPDGSDKARHSIAEHKEGADLVDEVDNADMDSPAWKQHFKKLKDAMVHHVDEEEEDVFPKARKLIDPGRATELARKFDERKPAEEAEEQQATG